MKRWKTAKENYMLQPFCNLIASALSVLDSKTYNYVQHKINKVLFKAQAGLLFTEEPTPNMQSPAKHALMPIQQAQHATPITMVISSPMAMNCSKTTRLTHPFEMSNKPDQTLLVVANNKFL